MGGGARMNQRRKSRRWARRDQRHLLVYALFALTAWRCSLPPDWPTSESRWPHVESSWRHLSCGSCPPRSWGSSWSASASSGAWCCYTSPSSSEPATRTALFCGSRSWTSVNVTSRRWLRRTRASWMGPTWGPWRPTVSRGGALGGSFPVAFLPSGGLGGC